jgi:hypothetical protein
MSWLAPIAGAVIGGIMGGGDSTSTTTQKADPWEGVQPALRQLYEGALQNFQGPGQQYYPGLTVAPQSGVTQQAQQALYQLTSEQNPVLGAASQSAYNMLDPSSLYGNPAMQDLYDFAGQDFLGSSPAAWQMNQTASGGMLNANPYLDQMFDRASSAVGRQFSKNVMPGIASMFSGAGRFGSNQMAEGLGQAQQQYGDTLDRLATDIYGGNYATERGLQQGAQQTLGGWGLAGRGLQQSALSDIGSQYDRSKAMQLQAMGLAPTLNQADYYGPMQLMGLGGQQDAYNQQLINADMARYNFGQQQPSFNLNLLSQLLQGYPQGSSSTMNQPGSALGGAFGGLQMGQAIQNQFSLMPQTNPPATTSSGGNEGDWYNLW